MKKNYFSSILISIGLLFMSHSMKAQTFEIGDVFAAVSNGQVYHYDATGALASYVYPPCLISNTLENDIGSGYLEFKDTYIVGNLTNFNTSYRIILYNDTGGLDNYTYLLDNLTRIYRSFYGLEDEPFISNVFVKEILNNASNYPDPGDPYPYVEVADNNLSEFVDLNFDSFSVLSMWKSNGRIGSPYNNNRLAVHDIEFPEEDITNITYFKNAVDTLGLNMTIWLSFCYANQSPIYNYDNWQITSASGTYPSAGQGDTYVMSLRSRYLPYALYKVGLIQDEFNFSGMQHDSFSSGYLNVDYTDRYTVEPCIDQAMQYISELQELGFAPYTESLGVFGLSSVGASLVTPTDAPEDRNLTYAFDGKEYLTYKLSIAPWHYSNYNPVDFNYYNWIANKAPLQVNLWYVNDTEKAFINQSNQDYNNVSQYMDKRHVLLNETGVYNGTLWYDSETDNQTLFAFDIFEYDVDPVINSVYDVTIGEYAALVGGSFTTSTYNTYLLSTEQGPFFNTPPTIEVSSPLNNSVDISLQPTVVAWINDTDGNQSTVDFYNSTNGIDWTWQQTNLTVLNETVNYTYTQANSYSTDYYWKVHANDGNDNVSAWFKFTTESAPYNNPPYQSNPSPNNNSNNVLITTSQITIYINDTEGNPMNWTIETSPDIGSQDNSSSSGANGTKTCSISGLSYSTTYTWYMNLTDDNSWNNATYSFTTEAPPPNNPPWQDNPSPSNNSENVSISLSEISIYINDTDGDGMNFTIETSPDVGNQDNSTSGEENGTKVCSVSGLIYSTVYTWWVNLSDGEDSNNSYYVFTTTDEPYNNPPCQSSPDPSNQSTGVSISLTNVSIYINDTEGNPMNWTIETSPDVGTNSSNSDTNGTKYCDISGLEYLQTYLWYVNITDGNSWTNASYRFNTSDNPLIDEPPILSNPYPANGSSGVDIVVTCRITVADPEGGEMNISFYENSTGNWTLQQQNDGVVNGTYQWEYTNATGYFTTYYWNVSAYDGANYTNATYNFTTVYVDTGESPDDGGDAEAGMKFTIPDGFLILFAILFATVIGALVTTTVKKQRFYRNGKKK